MTQETSFDFITNSPQAQLTAGITDVALSIPVDFCEYFSVIPAPYTITNDAGQAETIYVSVRSVSSGAGNVTVTREWDLQGTQGAARSWNSGDKISRNLGAKEQNNIIANVADHETRLADTTTGHDHDGTNSKLITSDNISIDTLSGATINTMQGLHNALQSSGALEAVTIVDSGSGTAANVSAFKAIFKTTDSQTGANVVADVAAVSSITIPEGLSWLVARYNSGTPIVENTATYSTINFTTDFSIARCYRDGDLAILPAGVTIYNVPSRDLQRIHDIRFIERASGLIISNPSGLYVGVSAGVVYTGYDSHEIGVIDTSGSDVFDYYYKDGTGGYTLVVDRSTINATQYDDGTGTLATISADGYYGVHWVYSRYDGRVQVVYGVSEYTTSQLAQDADPPASIPLQLREMALLIGKIIVQKTGSTFSSIQSVFDTSFVSSPVSEHDDLSGILGGGTYHLSSAQYVGITINKFNATTDPTINDDSGDGYNIGSRWVNVTDDKYWICVDTTAGAAVWHQTDASETGSVATDTIWDAKGDMVVGTGADTAQKLTVGANGTVPVADSGETTGIKWAALSGGSSAWTEITAFTATPASSSKITTTSDLTGSIQTGYPLEITIGGIKKYYIVTSITSSQITVAGVEMLSSISSIKYGDPARTEEITIVVNGYYADASNTTLIEDDLFIEGGIEWLHGTAYFVLSSYIHATNDSGATQPKINITIDGSDFFITDRSVSTSNQYTTVSNNSGNYDIDFKSKIEIDVTKGTNGDAHDLTVNLVLVYP